MGWASYYEDIEERRQESLLSMHMQGVKLGGQRPSSPQPQVVKPIIIASPPESEASRTEKREKRVRDLIDIHLLCLAAIRERTPLRH
jgi:hypothetical protein